jgi:hypothetical protein
LGSGTLKRWGLMEFIGVLLLEGIKIVIVAP